MWPFRKRVAEEQRALTSIPGYWPESGVSPSAVASVNRSLSLAPVFAAARLLADSLASLPPILYTRDRNGIPRKQPTPLLFSKPSIHGTLYDWLFRAVISMALQGDAIGLITARDYHQFPTMIEWLNPDQVATFDGKPYGPGSYMDPMWWWWGRRVDPKNLLHIPWFTLPYRVRGLSPIGAYQLTTNIGIGAQEYSANWFGQGGVPPGTFQNKERVVDTKDADEITSRLTARLQTRKPLVYGSDWIYTPIAIKPNEAEFVQTMQLTATHVAIIYGIPPSKLAGLTGHSMTYATTEMNNIDFLTHCLRPWITRLEYALTRCFPTGYFVKFDTSELLRVDAETRASIDNLSLGYQNQGWRTVDEVRASRDLPPLPKQPASATDASAKSGDSGNGGAPTPVSDANHALSGTRSGHQAVVELLSFRNRWQNAYVAQDFQRPN